MRFSLKVFLSTLLVAALVFGAAGFALIQSVFEAALEQEVRLAQEETQLLALSFQAAAAGGGLTDGGARRAAQSLAGSGLESGHLLRLSGEAGERLYSAAGAPDLAPLAAPPDALLARVEQANGVWFVQSARVVEAGGRTLTLESFRDISAVFAARQAHYALYRLLMGAVLLAFAAITWPLSSWLTAPIRRLSGAARRFAAGDYSLRAPEKGGDELALLTRNFNDMAQQLEQKIHALEEAARRREDFIAAFAHELRTPLTSVIGYADLLRSRQLEEAQQLWCANYIFTEGKRLEGLSLKLLDLIVLGRRDFPLRPTDAAALAQRAVDAVRAAYAAAGITLRLEAAPCRVRAEPDLAESLLINLCDNARKATPAGGTVTLSGGRVEDGYAFTVTDTGAGMTPEVLAHITEPFYMADKSRSRAQNGAGLGLALCAEIARLHGGGLTFESAPGAGTTARFYLLTEDKRL